MNSPLLACLLLTASAALAQQLAPHVRRRLLSLQLTWLRSNTKDHLALGRDVELRETGLLRGEAVVDALIVSEVFKVATGRQRPLEGSGGGLSPKRCYLLK